MYKKIASKKIFVHPRITLIEDTVELPDGTQTEYLRYQETRDTVIVLCKRADGKFLLTDDYSYPVGGKLLKLPGGGLEQGESPESGANRELMEEAGYRALALQSLGQYYFNDRRNDVKTYIFYADTLVKERLTGDVEEVIDVQWFSETEIESMIRDNKIQHVHTLAVWSKYKIMMR